jgi:hypothetical protein
MFILVRDVCSSLVPIPVRVTLKVPIAIIPFPLLISFPINIPFPVSPMPVPCRGESLQLRFPDDLPLTLVFPFSFVGRFMTFDDFFPFPLEDLVLFMLFSLLVDVQSVGVKVGTSKALDGVTVNTKDGIGM